MSKQEATRALGAGELASAKGTGTALMDEGEAAAYLGLTRRTLQAWRVRGGGPEFLRLSARTIRYRREAIDLWLADKAAASTSEYGSGKCLASR